jgi:hypothetical protein
MLLSIFLKRTVPTGPGKEIGNGFKEILDLMHETGGQVVVRTGFV